MARYGIFIRLGSRSQLFQRSGSDEVYSWDVREVMNENPGNLGENCGPSIAGGEAATVEEARTAAEALCDKLAQETTYIYDTNKQK